MIGGRPVVSFLDPVTIDLRVRCPGVDTEGLHELTRNLQQAVLAVEVDDVRPATGGRAPDGAKSAEVVAVGALIVTLAPIVMEGLVAVVASWLTRQPSDVEVEIDGRRFRGRVTRAQRDELVAAYVRRLDRDS
jgi:hypothetical protein